MGKSVRIEIKTAIRNLSWASFQPGEKSAQRILVDFQSRSIKDEAVTGHTEILGLTLGSVRDRFKVTTHRFEGGVALFKAIGTTASGVGFMPDIDYEFDFEVTENHIKFWGAHDGYPSYGISVDEVLRYDYVQGHIGQLLGHKDISVSARRFSIP